MLDTVFVERLVCSVNWDVDLHEYQAAADAVSGLDRYFRFDSQERPHRGGHIRVGYQTSAQGRGVIS